MTTILDNKEFRKSFKKHCMEQKIPMFYVKSVFANAFSFIRRPRVFLAGDFGDEVFDAVYEALEDIGYIDVEADIKVSPYDVLKMESAVKKITKNNEIVDTVYLGIMIEFKQFCNNFGKDRSDRILCDLIQCGQFQNCGKFF